MACLPSFQVPSRRSAVPWQSKSASENSCSPLRLRIGVHQGDVLIDDDDVVGDGVNIAARIEPLAEAGGIAISARVREDALGKLDIAYDDLGEPAMKNIDRPIRLYRVRIPDNSKPALALTDKPSLAVFPFTNLSGDPEQEYFADGVADELITALSRVRSLLVISRSCSFSYRNRNIEAKQIGRELGVRYVVDGSVRKSRDRVRLSAQLTDATNGVLLWADRFDGAWDDVFTIQDEVAKAVLRGIDPAISAAEQRRATCNSPDSLDAWDAYQRGLWHQTRFDVKESWRAREFFERAIELDPNFSRAYQGLVYSYIDEMRMYGIRPLSDATTIVQPPAERSLMLDPEDAGARTSMGWVLNTAGDNEAALVQADEALRCNPNYAEAERLKGGILAWHGRPAEGREILATYMSRNPRDPRKWQALLHTQVALYLLKDYAASIEAGRQVMRVNPTLPVQYRLVTYRWLVGALGQLGRISEAQHALEEARALVPAEELNSVFTRKVPWQREPDLQHLLEGLRKAGWRP